MTKGQIERNVTLDYFKIFLSLLVITIHLRPIFGPGLKSAMLADGIARIAVPCFFIINGYYFANKAGSFKAVKKYLGHLLLIYLVWSLIYSPYYYSSGFLGILETLVFGYSHLWYVIGLIIGIIVLVSLKKVIKNDTVLLMIGIGLFITGHFLEPMRDALYFVRNGLTFGFPFIMIGYYLKVKNVSETIKEKYLVPVLLLSFIFLLIESYFAHQREFVSDMFLSLLFLCPAIFLYIMKHSSYKPDSIYVNYLGSMASAIYFVHLLVIYNLSVFSDKLLIYKFPFVVLLSVLLSIVIIFVNKRIKIFL